MERWKPCHPNYEVSDQGRVRQIEASARRSAGSLVPQFPDDDGYVRVNLRCGTRFVQRGVHQLVALAFIGPYPPRHEVNHKDGVKTNNCARNLEYRTRSGNAQHAYDLGLQVSLKGESVGTAKLTTQQVKWIPRARAQGWSCQAIAEHLHVGRSTVYKILQGRRWSHLKTPVEKRC
jgi:hypothetical protein